MIRNIRTRRTIEVRKNIRVHDRTYMREIIDQKNPYMEKNQDFWFGRKILSKCWRWFWAYGAPMYYGDMLEKLDTEELWNFDINHRMDCLYLAEGLIQ
jgi:hypothetical protein